MQKKTVGCSLLPSVGKRVMAPVDDSDQVERAMWAAKKTRSRLLAVALGDAERPSSINDSLTDLPVSGCDPNDVNNKPRCLSQTLGNDKFGFRRGDSDPFDIQQGMSDRKQKEGKKRKERKGEKHKKRKHNQ